MITRRIFLAGAAALPASAAGIAGYAFAIEPILRLTVREWTIHPDAWPKGAPDLRIVALADFHVSRPWMTPAHITHIVKTAMRLKPDLIVLLGDYLRGVSDDWAWSIPSIAEWTPPLGRLTAPLGVYAILGNHDTELEPLRAGFAAINMPLLENASVKIGCNGVDFWLAGLGDQEMRRDDLAATLEGTGDGAPLILLAHEPDTFPRIAAADRHVMLTLSGHTHGGQVWLPLVTEKYTRERPYLYGHYTSNSRHLVVSGGLGCTRVPVRFLVPPEITVINVRAVPT